jgi:ferric-dicitrate binding protein FerR (iron transport regulator)
MIVMLEPSEAWSLMMLASAVAIDNADISPEGKEAIRRWRSEHRDGSAALEELTDAINLALNARLDAKTLRRVKTRGQRAETVRR